MQEIKMRIWDGKEYRYPPPIGEWDFEDCELFAGYNKTALAYELYTGLKDKNEREIYEGDIVEGRYLNHPTFETNGYMYMNWPIEQTAPIVCEDVINWKWGIYGHIDAALTYPSREFTIVGNIHENPELLL